jgi:putative transposase
MDYADVASYRSSVPANIFRTFRVLLRRSLACTNIIENVMGHGAARLPQRKTLALGLDGDALDRSRYAGSSQRLPTLKAHKQLPALRAALEAHQTRNSTRDVLARQANAA